MINNRLPSHTINRITTSMSLQKYIDVLTEDRVRKKFGPKFLEYLLTENGGVNIDNLIWYINAVNQNISIKGKLLDLGCGFGLHSILFQEVNPHITKNIGIDPNPDKISVFKKLLQELNLSNIQADLGVGEKLPYLNESFDYVYCNESLSHVRQLEQVLSEIQRVLKRGGEVIISDTAKWNPYALWFVYGKGHKHENYLSPREMRTLLIKYNFRDIRRVKGIVAPRNPLRSYSQQLWWLMRFIDPKYVWVGVK